MSLAGFIDEGHNNEKVADDWEQIKHELIEKITQDQEIKYWPFSSSYR